jgi:hypothetical protein
MGLIYLIIAATTLLLSFFCFILTLGNWNRVSETRGFHFIQKLRERPIHGAFTIISFMILVSVIGTNGFNFQEQLEFVTRTIFFGTHLLIGSFTVLWVSTKIDDVYDKMYERKLEQKIKDMEMDHLKIGS